MSTTIHQEIDLPAPLDRVFRALTESQQFSAFTGAPADIDTRPGGTFSCFGGMISGRTVELVPEQRIVQAWRAGNWDAGVYSIVRFELRREGHQTRLVLDQSGHPDGTDEHLRAGWPRMYWEPLKRFLA